MLRTRLVCSQVGCTRQALVVTPYKIWKELSGRAESAGDVQGSSNTCVVAVEL